MTGFELARFLGIGESDVTCVMDHADALVADADVLSTGFYDYLRAHPDTGRLLGEIGVERLAELSHLLVDNFRRMLRRRPDEANRAEQTALGTIHYRAGVMSTWLVGAYRLYIDYLRERLQQLGLAGDERRRLDMALIKYVLYDMSLQLEGYEQTRRADLRESDAIARAVLEATLSLDRASAPQDVLSSICDRVVAASDHLRAAWFCLGDKEGPMLAPAYQAGEAAIVPQRIELAAGDPMIDALVAQRPLAFDPTAEDAPAWSRKHPHIRSIGVFPFGLRNTATKGCLVVHADRTRYFDNAGMTIFEALATLAQLLLELRGQIQRDALTGLPNREALATHLAAACERSRRAGTLLCVGVLDLDDFKPINDRYGRAIGDELLRMLAERLKACLRDEGVVARLSGDEFALLLESFASLDEVEHVFAEIESALRQPWRLSDGAEFVLNASLGATVFPFDESPPDGLIRHADQAMYEVKDVKSGRVCNWRYWSPAGLACEPPPPWPLSARPEAFYQPVVDLQGGGVVAVEALARLRLADGRILAPAAFLGGMGAHARRDLSREMLRQGLDLLQRLDARGIHLGLSFNVDADFILDIGCVDCFRELVEGSGIAPQRITLEILESGEFLATDSALKLMRALREAGARIALDDVGSAYSSLLRLKELPIDRIKLDQAFVRDLAQGPDNLLFVMALQSLAQGLGVQLIVEGVETPAMLDAMIALGVDAVQGYALARPMSAAALSDWLEPGRNALASSGQTGSLLGAYAAHLRQRTLMDLIVREGSLVGSLDTTHCCPLVQYLISRGMDDDHPLLRVHEEIVGLFGGRRHLKDVVSNDARLRDAEQRLARLVSAALAAETAA